MNFYKDPLIEKLRLIESRPLSEGLSDEEWEQLKQLRAELDKDPDSAKLHADADALIKSKEPAAPNDIPTTPPVKPEKRDPTKNPYYDPNIAATQQLFNQKGITDNAGQRIKVDGVWGWRTEEAKWNFFAKFPANTPEAAQYDDLGGKVKKELQWRVIGDKGTGRTARGGPDRSQKKDPAIGNPSPEAAKAMGISPGQAASPTPVTKLTPAEIEKRNADIQSGKDVDASGNTTTPAPASTNPEIAKIDAEIKRFTSGGNNMSLQANKDYVANLEKKKAALAAGPSPIAAQPGIPPELSKAVPSPKDGDEYWVNGTRYVFKGFGGGRTYSKPKWSVDHSPGDFAFKASTEWATKNNFTGTPDQAQAQYMQKTFPRGYANPPAQAESTELDRLKQLLKF